MTDSANRDADRNDERAGLGPGDTRLVREAIRRAKTGDREGIHFLYVHCAADVIRYVQDFVGDRAEAESITHDVFANLPVAISSYEQASAPFSAWIARISRDAAFERVQARIEAATEEERRGPRSQLGLQRSQELRVAFEELPEDQREVLVLRHVARLSPEEVAEVLDESESTVNTLHARGRAGLRSRLADLEVG